MKIGPGRNSKSPSRWFQMDEPVTSDGMRSGVNWTRENRMLEHLGERARGERLREPGEVLEQDVAVGEEPDEDELERVSLADDGALDLVEHSARQLVDAFEVDAAHSVLE